MNIISPSTDSTRATIIMEWGTEERGGSRVQVIPVPSNPLKCSDAMLPYAVRAYTHMYEKGVCLVAELGTL